MSGNDIQYDQRKASYQACLVTWRSVMGDNLEAKPNFKAYGLTQQEAEEVERDGYDTSKLPKHFQPSQQRDVRELVKLVPSGKRRKPVASVGIRHWYADEIMSPKEVQKLLEWCGNILEAGITHQQRRDATLRDRSPRTIMLDQLTGFSQRVSSDLGRGENSKCTAEYARRLSIKVLETTAEYFR